jgi:hypothetical protein
MASSVISNSCSVALKPKCECNPARSSTCGSLPMENDHPFRSLPSFPHFYAACAGLDVRRSAASATARAREAVWRIVVRAGAATANVVTVVVTLGSATTAAGNQAAALAAKLESFVESHRLRAAAARYRPLLRARRCKAGSAACGQGVRRARRHLRRFVRLKGGSKCTTCTTRDAGGGRRGIRRGDRDRKT